MVGFSVPPIAQGHDFSEDGTATGLVNTGELDNELATIRTAINAIISALGGTHRDDDTLGDELVRLRNLHPEIDSQLTKRSGLPLTDRYSWRMPVAEELTVPPAEPDDGDRYLVAESATNDWAGLDGHLVQWSDQSDGWLDEGAPQDGWFVWVANPGSPYVYDGITGQWLPDWGASGWGDILNTFTITSAAWATGATEGSAVEADSGLTHLLLKVELSTAATSGFVTLEIHADAARTDLVWEHTWDLASSHDSQNKATWFETETANTLYYRVTNNTAAALDATWDVTAKQVSLLGVRPAHPGTVVGPGLDIINSLVQVMTHASVGTEVDAENRLKVVTDATQAVRVLHSALGLIVDGAVDLSTDQLVGGTKRFVRFGVQALTVSGPPTTVGHYRGELAQDDDGVLWHCIAGTASGDATDTWAVARPTVKNYPPTLTPEVAANTIHQRSIRTLGNAGQLLRFRVWAFLDGYAAGDIEIPFRVRFYPNSDYEGREALAIHAGMARSSSLSSAVGAAESTLSVAAGTYFDRGGLIRIDDGSDAEFARVATLAGGLSLDEATVNGYAADTPVAAVVELPVIPFWLDGGVHARDLYVEFENDHASQAVRFGFEAIFQNNGHYEWSS